MNKKLTIRERIYKWLFLASDGYKSSVKWLSGICRFCFSVTLFLFLIAFIFYFGFSSSAENLAGLRLTFRGMFLILFFSKYLPEILQMRKKIVSSSIFKIIVFLFSLGVLLSNFHIVNNEHIVWAFFFGNKQIIIAIFLIGITEISGLFRLISSVKIPPALIFSSSFLIIILIGSGLLMLPKAHNVQLSYLDSLFTSVSAVCVTGLVVVDTATTFTILGKIIILCLIQIGGLGIMTFTGFFSYIFISSSSFRERLLLKEIFSSESMNNLFKLLTKILILTFLTEIIGVLLIYSSLDLNVQNKVLFSIFHAVSAFCNAGFSTLSEGLFSPVIRYNYSVHIYVAFLIILGGIGFPVLINVYSFFKNLIIFLIRKVRLKMIPVKPVQRNVSARIVLFMTTFLILAGTGLYYLFESENSLKGIGDTQKIIAAFFGSVSARTAGFNMVDLSFWGYPTVFLMILLMWIGASPGSTGGGIKTTTFAIAFRSVWNNIKGREYFRIGNREIGSNTITRVLSIIFLSIITITSGFFCLLLSEPGKNPVHLLFECFSAFGTVGLSLANTGSFSQIGKIVVILLMFIGRVGPLTLLTGLLISCRKKYSRFPEVDIIIN